ncbi:MAG: PAS domain-containing protein, partial [Spirochaetes bacterium]|nr:PAS domain-containing protein [Spirochaetota bacterium]
ERWAEIVGYTLAEISPVSIRTWQEFTHPEDLARSEELLRAHFAGESEYYDCEVRMRHADGRWVWVRDRGKVAEWTDDGRPHVVFGTHEDITERKNLEEEREKALEERTALMRELTHRTKNNLMMVSSLIELKDQALADRADLADLRNQVNAIRVVHEKLHQSPETITHIDFREYAQELLSTVFSFSPEAGVRLEIDAPDISLPTRAAVTLGLIMNELATNAVKYGFRGADAAVFRLQSSIDDSGPEMTLRVSNTGTPIGPEIDFDTPHGLGLQLVQAMVGQLQGSIRLEREPVTTFTITVPLSE